MRPIDYDPTRTALLQPEVRDTVFVAGTSYTPLQLAVEAARLAYVQSETSPAQQARLTSALQRAGFGTPVIFADATTNSQGFGCIRATDGKTIVAFRGTQPDQFSDLATDLQAHTLQWTESAGKVHAGFAKAARALLPSISAWLEAQHVRSAALTVCGHSLGAAIATLAATVWKPARLVTIGSPRVGDQSFADTLAGVECIRIVDCCDAVTEVPPPLFGYTHVGPATYIQRDGTVVFNPAADVVTYDRAQAREKYFIEHAWKTGNVFVRDLADHAPINYVRAFLP